MEGFSALADPTRQRILALLAKSERPAGEIAARFDMTPPAVSQHLKVLREAGLVRVRPVRQQRLYSLNAERLAEMADWLARMGNFWNDRLDRLEKMTRERKDA